MASSKYSPRRATRRTRNSSRSFRCGHEQEGSVGNPHDPKLIGSSCKRSLSFFPDRWKSSHPSTVVPSLYPFPHHDGDGDEGTIYHGPWDGDDDSPNDLSPEDNDDENKNGLGI